MGHSFYRHQKICRGVCLAIQQSRCFYCFFGFRLYHHGCHRSGFHLISPLVLPPFYSDFSLHANTRVKILSAYRHRARSSEKDSKKLRVLSIFLFSRDNLSFPLIAILSLTRSVQLCSARPHCTRLIDFYTKRDEMCLPKPPERLKQRPTR